MDDTQDTLDSLVDTWLTLDDAADLLDVSVNRVRQWVREREIIAVRTEAVQQPRIPAACLTGGRVVKGLGGTLTLLADSGYDEEESARWMFTRDDSLPGRPIDALREDRGREVRRRAQALAF